MKGNRGTRKSLMAGAGLACLLSLAGGVSHAAAGWPSQGVARVIGYESARQDLGPSVGACWAQSVVWAAVSPSGWDEEMARLRDQMCVVPGPLAPPQTSWAGKGLLVIAYEGGLSGKTARIIGVSRSLNTLDVEVSLSTRVDGCGYCDQDEVRISLLDLLYVEHVNVRYTCVDCPVDGGPGPGAVTMESYNVGPMGGVGANDEQLSWGALKAKYHR